MNGLSSWEWDAEHPSDLLKSLWRQGIVFAHTSLIDCSHNQWIWFKLIAYDLYSIIRIKYVTSYMKLEKGYMHTSLIRPYHRKCQYLKFIRIS